MRWPLVVLAGPTAVGKTELSIRLASELGAHILSADSRQVYRHLDIGTAKASVQDRQRVPHHLIDVLDPGERYSAGAFARQVHALTVDLHTQGTPVVLVGGSGMYLEATIDGLGEEPAVDGDLRQHLEHRWGEEGGAALHAELALREPIVAARLAPSDRARILRALELLTLTGSATLRPASSALTPRPLLVALTRPRQELVVRIEQRVHQMLDAGWLEETRGLMADGVPLDAPGLESLGYRHVVEHLEGRLNLEEMISAICKATRQYAKRQMTWLRRDRRYRWLDLSRLGREGCLRRILAQWQSATALLRVDTCT